MNYGDVSELGHDIKIPLTLRTFGPPGTFHTSKLELEYINTFLKTIKIPSRHPSTSSGQEVGTYSI
jgi:hypothetical protein